MKSVGFSHKQMIAVALILLVAFAGNLSLFRQVQAAESGAGTGTLNLITSPLPISLTAKPGTRVSTDLRIKSAGASTERLKVGLLKFGAFGDEGKPQLLDFTKTDDYANWVTFSQPVFDAEPNVWKTIKMTINLPKSAAFGYYYAVTFSRAGNERATGARTNTLKGATAVLVLLNADVPNARREINVADFISLKGFYEYLPATLKVRLHNSGNVHLAPVGEVVITQGKDGAGRDKDVGRLKMNEDLGFILPNSNRIFQAQWADGFPKYVQKTVDGKPQTDKRADPVMELKWNFNDIGKVRFGRYTARLLMIYDDGKRDIPIEAQVSFWVIPWRFILGMVVVVVLTLLGLWFSLGGVRRKFRPKKRRR